MTSQITWLAFKNPFYISFGLYLAYFEGYKCQVNYYKLYWVLQIATILQIPTVQTVLTVASSTHAGYLFSSICFIMHFRVTILKYGTKQYK